MGTGMPCTCNITDIVDTLIDTTGIQLSYYYACYGDPNNPGCAFYAAYQLWELVDDVWQQLAMHIGEYNHTCSCGTGTIAQIDTFSWGALTTGVTYKAEWQIGCQGILIKDGVKQFIGD